jgi:hypothetical protein
VSTLHGVMRRRVVPEDHGLHGQNVQLLNSNSRQISSSLRYDRFRPPCPNRFATRALTLEIGQLLAVPRSCRVRRSWQG